MQAFKAVKKYIKDGRFTYICGALAYAAARGEITWTERDHAADIIQARLEPYTRLDRWVRSNVLDGVQPAEQDMRLYRLRWLDALSKEFKDEVPLAGRS